MISDVSNIKPLAAGLFFIAAGAFFSVTAYLTLDIGHLSAMGPGFFPLALGLILVVLGAAIAIQMMRPSWSSFGAVSVRGVVFIGLAPVLFSQTVEGLGILASVALTTLVACFSSRQMNAKTAVLVVGVTTVINVLIFHYLIALPIPLIGSWLIWGAA